MSDVEATVTRYRIYRDDTPYDDGEPPEFPWNLDIIRDGKFAWGYLYRTFREALDAYTAGSPTGSPPTP